MVDEWLCVEVHIDWILGFFLATHCRGVIWEEPATFFYEFS